MVKNEKLKLPVGIDGFEKIRRNGFYYIDKTKLIEQLFFNWGEVNLFTRPRRFGKSLFLSIMKAYYDILQKDRFESYSADYGLVRIPPTSATVSR